MPRETFEIALSENDPYQSGARYLAMLAYCDAQETRERDRFAQSIIRATIFKRMEMDPRWGQNLVPLRPAYFSGSEKEHEATMKRGTKRLWRRLVVCRYIVLPHLQEVDSGRLHKVDGMTPTVENMGLLALGKLELEAGSLATLKDRDWRPLKPVAHAICAYYVWDSILWKKLERNPDVDRQTAFLFLPEYVDEVVELSEYFRTQATRLRIREQDTVQFTTRRVDDEGVEAGQRL